jgi:hypothetical protein
MICDVRNDLWCQKWSVMSETICDVRNDLWCQKWSVMSEMICDVRNDLWCQKWSVMSETICDVRNDLWCQKWSVMSETICDVRNDLWCQLFLTLWYCLFFILFDYDLISNNHHWSNNATIGIIVVGCKNENMVRNWFYHQNQLWRDVPW